MEHLCILLSQNTYIVVCISIVFTSNKNMRVVRIKAQKIHGIVEAVTFISIILSCFFLVLKTSFLQESVSRDSSCIGPRGFANGIYNLFFEKDDAVEFFREINFTKKFREIDFTFANLTPKSVNHYQYHYRMRISLNLSEAMKN